jgi:hypothetical protein
LKQKRNRFLRKNNLSLAAEIEEDKRNRLKTTNQRLKLEVNKKLNRNKSKVG